MTLTVDSNGERGLLGVAFHPNFAANQFVYAYYTVPGTSSHNRIAGSLPTGDVLMAASELPLVDLPDLSGATNHNGGGMHFGVDGKLYVSVARTPTGPTRKTSTFRLASCCASTTTGPIPSDNPFWHHAGQFGLRRLGLWVAKPLHFCIQPGTGRIHINDVGQITWERSSRCSWGQLRVAGLGRPRQRHRVTSPGRCSPTGTLRPSPLDRALAVSSMAARSSAGRFTRQAALPGALPRSYFFADFCTSFVARLDLANGNASYAFGAVPGNPVGNARGERWCVARVDPVQRRSLHLALADGPLDLQKVARRPSLINSRRSGAGSRTRTYNAGEWPVQS